MCGVTGSGGRWQKTLEVYMDLMAMLKEELIRDDQ